MSLARGTRLGPYEITGQIGAGGMGEVYRARDMKLQREVAIKVLPEALAHDPERLVRLEREARTLASLNHPHIAQIHGLEESDGIKAVVMELVEGPTLADRIAQGPIPIDEALSIATQIADGLEVAHERGIIHRDLKPANIKLKEDGTVKVLDFGLAKAMDRTGSSPNVSQSPTITSPAMTRLGIILGTAAYMSPEQARGKTLDQRADIWAFGCVLYEMLTGRPAFEDEDVSMTLSKVLQREPDFDTLPRSVPPPVRQALRLCLRKHLKQRISDIRDLRLALDGAFETTAAPTPATASRLAWMAAFAVAVVVVVAMAVPLVRHLREPAPPVTHLEMGVLPAERLVLSTVSVRPSRTALAISPDGRRVVFNAMRGTAAQLYIRGLDQAEAQPISGTEGARGPFLSPDGVWIGFWADNQIKKVPIAGGPIARISDAPAGNGGLLGASWGDDGTIVFATAAGISKVSSDAGTPALIIKANASTGERLLLPYLLPGGKSLLFTAVAATDWETANVVLYSLDTGERRVLIPGGVDARYVSTGHLVYMKTGTLMAVPFDTRSQQLTGTPVALVEGVMHAVTMPNIADETGAGQFTVSTSGTLLYVVGGISPALEFSLVWVDRTGTAQPLTAATRGPYLSPRLSPDGQKFALSDRRGTGAVDTYLSVYDLVLGAPTRLVFSGRSLYPIWSPDGQRLAYSSNMSGAYNLYAINADGSGKPERLTTSDYWQYPSSWASAGNAIAFVQLDEIGGSHQIWVLPMDSDRTPRLLWESRFSLMYPEFSPDGHWIAYVSNESGAREVYVQPYPGPGQKIRISTSGGTQPIWTAKGRELLYRSSITPETEQVVSVAIRSLAPFRHDAPRPLFEAKDVRYLSTDFTRSWDVSADGQQFLMLRYEASTDKPVTAIHVVQNWTEELKRLVPTK